MKENLFPYVPLSLIKERGNQRGYGHYNNFYSFFVVKRMAPEYMEGHV
jgi:hypothetical protein